MDVPEFDGGAAARDRSADAAALLCGRAVPREPADVWLLRNALATLAAGNHGAGCDCKTGGAVGSDAARRRTVCDAAAGTRRSQGSAAERACGGAGTAQGVPSGAARTPGWARRPTPQEHNRPRVGDRFANAAATFTDDSAGWAGTSRARASVQNVSPDSPLNRSGPMGDADPPPSLPFGPALVPPQAASAGRKSAAGGIARFNRRV